MTSPNGRRVLVVEDEMMVAMGLELALKDAGHCVVGPVGTIDGAMEAAAREPIDCALLDVNLRGCEVFPVADILAARHVPFVFLTGYGREGLPTSYAACAVLAKPFRPRDLLATIEGLAGDKPAGGTGSA